jgi:hypothetical protein
LDAGNAGDDGHGNSYDFNSGCCSRLCGPGGICGNFDAAVVANSSNAGFAQPPGSSCSTGYDCGADSAEELIGTPAECLNGSCCRPPDTACGSDADCCLGHCQDDACGCHVDGQPCPALFADAGTNGNGYDLNFGCCSAACGSDGLCANNPD